MNSLKVQVRVRRVPIERLGFIEFHCMKMCPLHIGVFYIDFAV